MKAAIALQSGEVPAPPPNAVYPMSWAVDFVLTLSKENIELTPALQRLVPLSCVVIWAQQVRALPPWQDIADRWNVHRATVYRWLPELRRARQAVGKA